MNLIALATLLGIVFPPAIALVMQEHWAGQLKAAVAVVLCAAAAAATVIGTGRWHGLTSTSIAAIATAFTGLVIGTWGSYDKLWQQLGITQWIERATTFAHQAADLWGQLTPAQRAQLLEEARARLGDAGTATTS